MFGTAICELKNLLLGRKYVLMFLALVTITVITTSTLLSIKTVTVTADGKTFTVKSLSPTVGDFIESQDITLGEYDSVSPMLTKTLKDNQTITIERAFGIKLIKGAQEIPVQTTAKTVKDVLSSNGIEVGEMDIVSPSLTSVVTPETVINVTKVTSDMVAVEEEIAFKTVSTPNPRLARGERKVVTQGTPGVKKLMYSVTYHNGVEQARELVGETIVSEPVNEVIEYGTKYAQVSRGSSRVTVSNPGESLNYSASYDYVATAYSAETCGNNITASGMLAVKGVVAVDRRYIPLGTKLYVQSLDGTPDYGYAVAGDTGGAIKGSRIDLCMNSHAEAVQYGRRNVRIYVLSE